MCTDCVASTVYLNPSTTMAAHTFEDRYRNQRTNECHKRISMLVFAVRCKSGFLRLTKTNTVNKNYALSDTYVNDSSKCKYMHVRTSNANTYICTEAKPPMYISM